MAAAAAADPFSLCRGTGLLFTRSISLLWLPPNLVLSPQPQAAHGAISLAEPLTDGFSFRSTESEESNHDDQPVGGTGTSFLAVVRLD